MSNVLPAGLNIANGWTTAFSQAITGNSGGNLGASIRVVLNPAFSGSEVRFTVKAGTGGPMSFSHASVGTQSSAATTTAVPVEVKFNGASGLGSIAANATAASDWCPFRITQNVPIIFIADVSASDMGAQTVTGITSYFATSTSSWNVASGSGFTSSANTLWLVTKIEVR